MVPYSDGLFITVIKIIIGEYYDWVSDGGRLFIQLSTSPEDNGSGKYQFIEHAVVQSLFPNTKNATVSYMT